MWVQKRTSNCQVDYVFVRTAAAPVAAEQMTLDSSTFNDMQAEIKPPPPSPPSPSPPQKPSLPPPPQPSPPPLLPSTLWRLSDKGKIAVIGNACGDGATKGREKDGQKAARKTDKRTDSTVLFLMGNYSGFLGFRYVRVN